MPKINIFDSLKVAQYGNLASRFGNYNAKAIAAAAMIRGAAGYEPYIVAFPKPTEEAISGRGFWRGRATVSPETFIVAINGTSDQAAGFTVRIKDLGTGRDLFKSPISAPNCTGFGTSDTPANPIHFLPSPVLCKDPGLIEVQINNLATVEARIQVCLFTAQPTFEKLEIVA